jgi:hypothetical protein
LDVVSNFRVIHRHISCEAAYPPNTSVARTDEETTVRRNQFRAACPGIGWEREQRKPTTIGGRSTRWRVTATTATTQTPPETPDEDTVIIRGTD